MKDELTRASKQIGLTESQAENLWDALQEIQRNHRKSGFLMALLYIGAIITFLSMSWFYIAHIENNYALLSATAYALTFFCFSFYFWRVKNLKVPGGVLACMGILMVPLIVYLLQKVLHRWPIASSDNYTDFYHWVNGNWMPMEICTLGVACIVFYFIRFPLITIPIYSSLTFMSMDAIHLFVDPKADCWRYYCIISIAIGTLLNILGFGLYRREQKDFGFWSFLFGMFLCWNGLSFWNIKTEWGQFAYFLINCAFIFLSSFFHRKIFMFFGSLGIICYIGHLAYIFSESFIFSYVLAAIGCSLVLLATFLMCVKKDEKSSMSPD